MASPEPSFEGFFSTQHRPSTQSSFDLPSKNYGTGHDFGTFFPHQMAEAPIQYADEPQSLEPRDHRVDHTRQDNGLRKDSVPFDPSTSSTLIASAANGSSPNTPGQFQDPAYAYEFQRQQQHQQQPQQQAQDMSFLQQRGQPMGGEQYYEGNGVGSTPQTGDWNNSMLQQQGSGPGSRRASFTGGGLGGAPFEDSQNFEELQRM
jgi:hypothetical protein